MASNFKNIHLKLFIFRIRQLKKLNKIQKILKYKIKGLLIKILLFIYIIENILFIFKKLRKYYLCIDVSKNVSLVLIYC